MGAHRNWDRVGAIALAIAALALYLRTMCRTVYWYDSAEYVAAAVTLGIPHPPGYPLYTMIGHVFTWLPLEPALAINLMSAVFAALAVALAFLVARRLGAGRLASAFAAAALTVSPVFWQQATIAEVYTTGLTFLLGSLWLVLHGLERNRPAFLVLAAGVAGLGLGVHLSLATCGVGLVWLVACQASGLERPSQWRSFFTHDRGRRLKTGVQCLLALLMGACIYLWLPLRASMDVKLKIGNPSNLRQLWWYVSGGPFKKLFLDEYELGTRADQIAALLVDGVTGTVLLLAALGLARLFRDRFVIAIGVLLMMVGNMHFFFNYDVHDLEVFFLPTMCLLILVAAVGAQALFDVVGRYAPARHARVAIAVCATSLMALPALTLARNFRSRDLSRYRDAESYGLAMVKALPPGALVLNYVTPEEWKRSAVFWNHFQIVKGLRPDVKILSGLAVPPATLRTWLAEGAPLYGFAPAEPLTRHFQLEPAGPAWRLVAARR